MLLSYTLSDDWKDAAGISVPYPAFSDIGVGRRFAAYHFTWISRAVLGLLWSFLYKLGGCNLWERQTGFSPLKFLLESDNKKMQNRKKSDACFFADTLVNNAMPSQNRHNNHRRQSMWVTIRQSQGNQYKAIDTTRQSIQGKLSRQSMWGNRYNEAIDKTRQAIWGKQSRQSIQVNWYKTINTRQLIRGNWYKAIDTRQSILINWDNKQGTTRGNGSRRKRYDEGYNSKRKQTTIHEGEQLLACDWILEINSFAVWSSPIAITTSKMSIRDLVRSTTVVSHPE
jgi:hypothetical protein